MEVMKRLALFCILSAAVLQIAAQGREVTGIITDQRGVPIVGPTICQNNTSNCATADREGIFRLVIDQEKEMKLHVECLGFKPMEIDLNESTTYPLKVTLTPMYLTEDLYPENDQSENSRLFELRPSIPLSFYFVDFDDFTSLIGSWNTDLMGFFAVAGPEIGVSVSKFYTGIGFGWGYDYSKDNDSLIVAMRIKVYSLNLGYDIISSAAFRVTPLLSFRWMRFRLLNYANEKKIPLTQYLDERDLDLRFNQLTFSAGLAVDYKFYFSPDPQSNYWSLGLYGGYILKLSKNPWIYSRGNHLTSDGEIDLNPFTFSLSVSFYFNSYKKT
jgi:hypothetical protein